MGSTNREPHGRHVEIAPFLQSMIWCPVVLAFQGRTPRLRQNVLEERQIGLQAVLLTAITWQ
jgi:hypothetical protein